MTVETPDGGARHPIATVLGCLVVVDDEGVADDGGGPAQRQVGVSEEALGGGQVATEAGDGEGRVLVLEVAHLAPTRVPVVHAVPVHAKIKGDDFSGNNLRL